MSARPKSKMISPKGVDRAGGNMRSTASMMMPPSMAYGGYPMPRTASYAPPSMYHHPMHNTGASPYSMMPPHLGMRTGAYSPSPYAYSPSPYSPRSIDRDRGEMRYTGAPSLYGPYYEPRQRMMPTGGFFDDELSVNTLATAGIGGGIAGLGYDYLSGRTPDNWTQGAQTFADYALATAGGKAIGTAAKRLASGYADRGG